MDFSKYEQKSHKMSGGGYEDISKNKNIEIIVSNVDI